MDAINDTSLALRQTALMLATAIVLATACKSQGEGGPSGPSETKSIALSLNPTNASVVQGGSFQVTGTLTRSGGFTGDVDLFLVNAPSTLTATAIGQTVGTTTTALITIEVGPTTPAQTYPITVLAKGTGVADATAQFTLTVTAGGGFTLGISPAGSVTLAQGTLDNSKTVMINRTNYTANITLTADNVPTGLTATFAPNPANGTSAALSLSASATLAPGTYSLTLRGTGPAALRAPGDTANLEAVTTLDVTVTAAGSFVLGITPTGGVSLAQGTTNTSKTVTITRTNYSANVALTAEGLPTGLTASFAGNPVSGNSSVLTLTASASLAPSTYNITIRGTGPAALRAPDDTANVDSSVILAVTVTAAGSFALGLTPTGGVTLQQGATDNSRTVTITRTNYTAPVTLTAENLPTGLSAAFTGNPVSGNSSVLTLTASAGVTPNTYTITIRGTGPAALRASGDAASLEATTNLSVTITATPAGSFALGITPAGTVSLQQGASDNSRTVTISRTNYTAPVTLTAENLPSGLTAAFAGNPTSGNSSAVTLTASAAVAPNTYTITIRGTGPAALRSSGTASSLEATATLLVTVTAPAPSGNVTVSFVGCNATPLKLWAQDGTAPWILVAGNNDLYSFNVFQSKAAIVWRSGETLYVRYLTKAELTATNPYRLCDLPPASQDRRLSGIATGADFENGTDQVVLSFADGETGGGSVNQSTGQFSIFSSLPGPHDFVGYLHPVLVTNGSSDRVTLLRDQNPAQGGSIGTVNLAAGFLLTPGIITLTGPSPGSRSRELNYLTGASCDNAVISVSLDNSAPTLTVYGVPSGQQRATDFHELGLFFGDRAVWQSFHSMADRTITVGGILPPPTLSNLSATRRRIQVAFNLPADYQTAVDFSYRRENPFGGSSLIGVVRASVAWLGGTGNQTLAVPDLSGAPEWNDNNLPSTFEPLDWTLEVSFDSSGGNRCVEGSRLLKAWRRGSL